MPGVEWIKIAINMFEDDKVRLIDALPEKDAIQVIWIKLLIQAGKTNASGWVYFEEGHPYSDEMLGTLFNRPVNVVRLALATFQKFGMIDQVAQGICVLNWNKHQNMDGLEKIRLQGKLRIQKHREKQQQLLLKEGSNVTGNDTATLCNVTVTEQNKNKDVDIDLDKDIKSIFDVWVATGIWTLPKKTDKVIRKIRVTLPTYSVEEIIEGIKNYAEILKSDKYWWTHKWTLDLFLHRGLEQFKDGEVARQNYLKQDKKTAFSPKPSANQQLKRY